MVSDCMLAEHIFKKFIFWNVHETMNISGLLQSERSSKGFTLTLQEIRSIQDSMNIPTYGFVGVLNVIAEQPS